MRRATIGMSALLACLAVVATSVPARACGYGGPSPLLRFVQTDCVVVGKVTTVEEKPVLALPYPGAAEKQPYTVVVVEVSEAIKGAEGLTHIRLGLAQHQVMQPGFEACFLLAEHFDESFYYMSQWYDYAIARQGNGGFGAEVDTYRTWSKMLNKPLESLRAKNAEDRFLAAALLLTNYRSTGSRVAGPTVTRTAPIDAAESKLILETLAEADWSKRVVDFRTTGYRLFNILGLTEKDGWKPEGLKTLVEIEAAAKQWLKDNASTYRIQTFVRS